MQQLVSAFILICLNYCNSILIGLPWSAIAPLQQVQNAAAQPGNRPRDHVRSALHELQWLPIPLRIKFKVAMLMFLAHTNQCPAYIREAVTSVSCSPSQCRLRSSDGTNYATAMTRTKFGGRAFSVARPSVWNSLPEHIRSATNKHCFKHR